MKMDRWIQTLLVMLPTVLLVGCENRVKEESGMIQVFYLMQLGGEHPLKLGI